MKKTISVFVLGLICFLSGEVFAKTPQEYVVEKHSDVLRNVGNPGALLLTLDEVVDYGDMVSSALRDHWGGMEDAERLEFRGLMGILVRRSYQKNVSGIVGWRVVWRTEGEFVRGVAEPPRAVRAEPVELGYRLRPEGDGYRVVDIELEGLSVVDGYRRQFDRIIKKEGVGGLLNRLREKALEDDGC